MANRRKRTVRSKRNDRRWLVAGAVAAIAIVGALAGVDLASARPSSSSALNACGTPVCGSANAPVTIEIYSDFQ